MPLIGTAGHVDHGKSTLIRQITGRDPDRWDEEKRRGLTIDLGFAWMTLRDGTEVSFVDVPGHERYLKNMLAGVEVIDVALFVVAADEGWMPQSEEHLAVLDLLEIDRGVVALTKTDIVDPELLELARAEVSEKLSGTTLDGAPIVAVSGITGEGVGALVDVLADLTPPEPPANGRPRLWVDRSFTIAGAGTVVTGSLLGSTLEVDQGVEVFPDGLRTRVRGIQSHEQQRESVGPGRRVAVNLAGVDHDSISRGDMIGLPGQWELTTRFSATLRSARFVEAIEPRGAYQIHIGSGAHLVEVVALDGGAAVMQVDRRLPLAAGDRFVLRDTGRHLVVGGGVVVDPAPGPTQRAIGEVATTRHHDPDTIAQRLLASRRVDRLSRLMAHSGGGRPVSAVLVGDLAAAPDLMEEIEATAHSLVTDAHQRHPLRQGLSIATLAERLGIEAALAEAVVARSPRLERRGPDVAQPGHVVELDEDQAAAWHRATERLSESLAVPDLDDLGLDPEVIHFAIRTGELVRINESLGYLVAQIDELKAVMAQLPEDFTVAEFRDAVGLSRKYAVPLLEWSDREGLTIRRGDRRRLR
ncbi:MAG TPA: selenocysteine-specific translation elongation factor [Acidimicrobiia bacterium]|nr:selenocysteine-specific translation elongation factor [Acidimicrobiia bacterium]